MDLEYDQKFEEMKKYIPFLESMIKRLENTNNGGNNPRKAQLDKIRSLRDLLQDKKKRMKMENLLKCETVLVNLYAKVEQRDASLDLKKDSTEQTQNEQSDLSIVRSKLKSVASKLHGEVPETLPEIARATNTEVVCTPGSKEPALFQRRPNKASLSPPHESTRRASDDNLSLSKRNYTRVLLSPEPKKKEWSEDTDINNDKPLFSRRSPRRSPRRYLSPAYKKERKKSSKRRSKSGQQSEDLNITLKVPEESLSSLNTKDILSRIINCSDSDVDIDTLRGLRSQILGELKQTGAKDDISDLILKSYKNKEKRSKLKKKTEEVEEGEISDSESEIIENVYGSLVVVNKDEGDANSSKQSNDQQPRKIQICLVINSDKEKDNKANEQNPNDTFDITEFEAFTDEKFSTESKETSEKALDKGKAEKPKENVEKVNSGTENNNTNSLKFEEKQEKHKTSDTIKSKIESNATTSEKAHDATQEKAIPSISEAFKPNFYQSLTVEKSKSEDEIVKENQSKSKETESTSDNVTRIIEMARSIRATEPNVQKQTKKDEVSEIDILQALKKEILGETVPVSISGVTTPAMHQPKITKVSSAQEIVSKKRISIENYKQKSNPSVTKSLFIDAFRGTSKDDNSKKQSLKLTEKECERFNLPIALSHNDSDDEDRSEMSLDDIYGNLAPKSPDHEDFADTGIKPPVIIPSDPVKNVVASSKVDIDMRTLMSVGSPVPFSGRKSMTSPLITSESVIDQLRGENSKPHESGRKSIADRVRTESTQPVPNDSTSSYLTNFDRLPRPGVNYSNITPDKSPSITSNIPPLMSLQIGSSGNPSISPNIPSSVNPIMTPILNPNLSLQMNVSMASNMSPILTPILTPNMTPSRNPVMAPVLNPMMTSNPIMPPIMTPNARSYEMAPCQNFDKDDYTNQKHVYAPMFPPFEQPEYSEKDSHNKPRWETNENTNWEDRNLRNTSVQNDLDYQRHRNDRYKRGMDSPQIRMDCPSTPIPSFGRMETPMTPVHPFGRSDCPMTPSHPFGRSDGPMTPSHTFGRSDCPMTPSHPFGRSESIMTPSNAFGRDDYHNTSSNKYNKSYDPRLNRSSNYDKYQNRNDERNRLYYKDNRNMPNNNNKYRRYQDNSHEEVGRNDRDRISRQESSVGRSMSRDYDKDAGYHGEYYNNDYRYRNEKSKGFDDARSQRNYRARSIGRMNPSEDSYSPREEHSTSRSTREGSIERPISVQSHSGRSFNIDTSFNRTFQESKSSRDMSFDARRQRASSVGRCLHESLREDSDRKADNYTKVKPDVPDRSRATNFRRACSVGRDLKDYNTDKNFKDIKADLRACKFDYLDTKSQNRDDKSKTSAVFTAKSNESQSNRDSRSKSRDYGVRRTKNDDSCKYSPNNNNRDPRVRREINNQTSGYDKNKDKDRKQANPRYKNHGIVYSSDNIAKGTILASTAGVKNFKIPKIKRPVEENEGEKVSKVSDVTKKEVPTLGERKVENSSIVQIKNSENKARSESPADKRRNKDKIKEHTNAVPENPKSKPDTTSSSKKEEKTTNQLNELVSSDSDSSFSQSERRITRSVKRNQMKANVCKESNVKRSKRIKKPIIYDSDSDSQAGQNIDENAKERNEENKQISDIETKEKQVKTGKEKAKKDLTKKVDESAVLESTKPNVEINKDVDEEKIAIITNDVSQGQNNTLDISFGTDDELFSDNIGSGSVLDNIKALIADLDTDIEAPKINDFNDKFINNIISSNNSPIPLEVNESDFVSDMLINQKMDFGDMDFMEKNVSGSQNVDQTKDKSDAVSLSKNEDNIEKNISDLKNTDNKSEILNDNNEKKENKSKESTVTAMENLKKSETQTNSDERANEIRNKLNNLNNEAIVSTTALEAKSDEIPKDTQNTSSTLPTGDSFLIPDTTFNSNEANNDQNEDIKDSQESIPDSTNELTSEMNSDITSTHNSADNSTEPADPKSSCADNLPRIDSIGKLLSILEDKNKIKELLTLLGKDSGENEKIKKKLEKLSEIVSDDEEATNTDSKNNDVNKKKSTEKECKTNDVDSSTDTSIPSNQNNESEVDIHGKKPEKENNTSDSQVLDVGSDNDKGISSKQNKVEDKDTQDKGSLEDKDDTRGINNELLDSNTLEGQEEVKNTLIENINNEDSNLSQEELSKEQKDNEIEAQIKFGGKTIKKPKYTKKGRFAKKPAQNKRVTRSNGGSSPPILSSAPKKPSRELLKLQEDIREMFISEDVLNATGIRMCRLAKMVDEKNPPTSETEPVVVLEKIKGKVLPDETVAAVEKTSKKKNPKVKPYTQSEGSVESESKEKAKYKVGPKSKTKKHDDDPYVFDTESLGESSYTVDSKDHNSDSESESGDSVKSFESTELLVELKKRGRPPKRKRPGWKVGIIRKKNSKKKKAEAKNTDAVLPDTPAEQCETSKDNEASYKIPDLNCFTDKSYCFNKNVKVFSCRLCGYSGEDIVPHYKTQHPHSEIPLSRLNPVTAKEAIAQCEEMNLQAVSQIRTKKYVCRFCFKEFVNITNNSVLETFFWHVVSVHTGEYKQLCSECINVTRCPFNLDIPPPPKNLKGQLIGYICGRCNFTQVSLENLKTHVIVRHDDKQTEVFSINLADISRKLLQTLLTKTANETPIETPRVLRSSRSSQSVAEQSDDRSDVTDNTDRGTKETLRNKLNQDINISPKEVSKKFSFETEYMSDTSNYSKNDEVIKAGIKLERDDDENQDSQFNYPVQNPPETPIENVESSNQIETTPYSDVFNYPHFKIKLSGTGTKEYICCINGKDNHYKTTLLISLKKHVQMKHSENWDGYCFVCKVIVTSQGAHTFKDCLQHFLDKHMDNFPILENHEPVSEQNVPSNTGADVNDTSMSKAYINVRPLSQLISSDEIQSHEGNPSLPKIQSVVSLGAPMEISSTPEKIEKIYKYEESQAEIMSKKHRIVLDTMLNHEKLIQIFKCAGRFCSYTTDNLEEALDHASTHEKIGGENSLKCSYCDFDPMGNAIDLVTHVFKSYSHCSYACSKCFYRASASQLVYAHIKRVHTQFDADSVAVLSSTSIGKDISVDEVMSRDQAVLYYVCNNGDPETEGTCQFRSFVLTKFREHLQSRHAKDHEFSCYICNITTPSTEHLAQHLKTHGLRIYQCCRCLFGADNEADLLAHASALHPLKQPKAYLRITTSKGNSSEVRVLPLAVLSKSTVQTTVVAPSADKDNPVKQAERSIDLEKLIGHTSLHNKTNVTTIEPTTVAANDAQIHLESQQMSDSDCSLNRPHESTSPAVLTLLKEQDTTSQDISVKIEPLETPEATDDITPETIPESIPEQDVVCIDSDDDSRQNVIDLSSEDVSTAEQHKPDTDNAPKIPRSRLYKCSNCLNVNKNEATFKRHLLICYPGENQLIPCAHCSHTAPWTKIVDHYTTTHWKTSTQYPCTLCNSIFVSMASVKRHMRIMHDDITCVPTKYTQGGLVFHNMVVDGKRQVTKRKLSGELTTVSSEPATKLTKYGPQDVDRLPINPILDNLVHCSLCEFSTKVRLNMVRHLQLHAEQQPVPRTAPVNPVPHLETNEKHFDKMVNLASSSATLRNDKANKDGTSTPTEHLSPEAAAIYPKYVPDRHRYTCGAKDCSYISVNESMFKFHWETLHNGTNNYHCVHCPPHQHLDTTKPLTAARIIAHLKMHDTKLYACSSCAYYHHIRKVMDKHFKEVHKGRMIIVREEGVTAPSAPVPQPVTIAPTMDLKPWQCGLCSFKSMLRPEVIDHCGKAHQSKMQFKCTYCGFRTSNIENISNHQSKQHPGKKEEVFYFYYREGSIPEEADGTARWQKQSQKTESGIKTETNVSPPSSSPTLPKEAPAKLTLNLDIVKKEVIEPETEEATEETIEDLCRAFGQFCDPNGLKYKCSLCKVVIEDSKDAMQSHLYEELQYRKWGCGFCSYKAFHKPGLQQHVQTEHRTGFSREEPIALQVDTRVETWVARLLEYQTTIIERNKENLAKQKVEILRSNPGPSTTKVDLPEPPKSTEKPNVSMAELERLFGPFGVPSNMNYSCPKCNITSRSDATMQEHLESELNKIRWCCNVCSDTFQTYHEAQFHCRSKHPGQSSRPVEATRDVGLRAAWVTAVLQVQKLSMNYMPVKETDTQTVPPPDNVDNSLLVVRYSEDIPTPEEQMKINRKSDSDDDRLVIDEPQPKKTPELLKCSYCSAIFSLVRYYTAHVLKHYGLKPFTCPYCPYSDFRKQMECHMIAAHAGRALIYKSTVIPSVLPAEYKNTPTSLASENLPLICFACDKTLTNVERKEHFEELGKKGDIVLKCCHCISMYKNVDSLVLHHNQCHQKTPMNYIPYVLNIDSAVHWCFKCNAKHPFLKDLKSHCIQMQSNKKVARLDNTVIEIDDEEVGGKRKADDNTIVPIPKRVAKKSTTKLPDVVSVAKKSTTKLPFDVPSEYSYYGTKPDMDNLDNVTTLMPFCNTMVPFSLKKLSEIIQIYPLVVVKDINK